MLATASKSREMEEEEKKVCLILDCVYVYVYVYGVMLCEMIDLFYLGKCDYSSDKNVRGGE